MTSEHRVGMSFGYQRLPNGPDKNGTGKVMTPRKLAHVTRMVDFLSRNEERGRTVPAISNAVKFDSRADSEQDAEGWRLPKAENAR